MPPPTTTKAASAIHTPLREPPRDGAVTCPAVCVETVGTVGPTGARFQLCGGVGAQLCGRAALAGTSGAHWSGGSCAVACCSAMLIACVELNRCSGSLPSAV